MGKSLKRILRVFGSSTIALLMSTVVLSAVPAWVYPLAAAPVVVPTVIYVAVQSSDKKASDKKASTENSNSVIDSLEMCYGCHCRKQVGIYFRSGVAQSHEWCDVCVETENRKLLQNLISKIKDEFKFDLNLAKSVLVFAIFNEHFNRRSDGEDDRVDEILAWADDVLTKWDYNGEKHTESASIISGLRKNYFGGVDKLGCQLFSKSSDKIERGRELIKYVYDFNEGENILN